MIAISLLINSVEVQKSANKHKLVRKITKEKGKACHLNV